MDSGADHAADCRKRHGFVQPAEVRRPDPAGHVEHRPGGHEQKRFVDDVAEGMGDHPVYGQLGSDPDSAYHKAHLIDEAISQNTSYVVHNNRIENGKTGHKSAGPD